jgi:hypothetical protein
MNGTVIASQLIVSSMVRPPSLESASYAIRCVKEIAMTREFRPREVFSISNPNKPLVVRELDKLRREWAEWFEFGKGLGDSPEFDPNTCSEAIKDGRDNLRKHELLREKTLVFIGNNFTGYGFLFENWPSYPHEDNTSRVARKGLTWIQRLDTLANCIAYARVPDSYWTAKGKQLVDAVTRAPEKAVEIAASYLKNPTAS